MYWFWIVAMSINLDWFMSLTRNISSSFYAVLATHFIELDSSSTISSPTCHSARRACPKLQNPLPHFVKKKLLPGDKVPARADEGWGKVLFPGPHPPSDSPPAPGIKGLFFGGWILRLRLRLRTEWQGRKHAVKIESFWTLESNRKEICCYEHWFFNDAMCIG